MAEMRTMPVTDFNALEQAAMTAMQEQRFHDAIRICLSQNPIVFVVRGQLGPNIAILLKQLD
jgi:hypothetical protein